MKLPNKFYILVCQEWSGSRYITENLGVYTTQDTANMAAEYLQGNYKRSDIEYWVDEVDFCEIWKP